MSSAEPRLRRSSAEVRALLLTAARALFAEDSYDRVSTRAIAAQAQVTHATLFRHFATKDDLFVAAVFNPFSDFVTEYVRRWADGRHGQNSPQQDTEEFVQGLYELFRGNRSLLAAMAGPFSSGLAGGAADLLNETFAQLQRDVDEEVAETGSHTIDISYAVRFSFALVYGLALLDDALLPRWPGRPSHDEIGREVAAYVLRGSSVH